MNELKLLSGFIKDAREALKSKKHTFTLIAIVILIVVALLALLLPSQKTVKAYETTQLYFDSITEAGIFTLLPAEEYPSSLQTSTSTKAWGYDDEPTCTDYNNIASWAGDPVFYDGSPYIFGLGTNNIEYAYYPIADGNHYLCFGNTTSGDWYYIHFSRSSGIYSTDEYTTGPTFEITSPPDGSTQTTSFDVAGNYNTLGQDWDRLMIIFEDWDASSTCPIYGTEDYSTEYPLYFNNQSRPYFSDYFATSTGVATTTIYDIAKGSYRCTRCYFINEETGSTTQEVCNGYGVEIPNSISEEIPSYYVGENWADFYTEFTDKWATSTELFAGLAGKVAPILDWVGGFTSDFKNLFNASSSADVGQQIGNAIPVARGYLTIVNYYFSGLPVSEIFIFYLLTALIIIVLKIVLMIWHFFRGQLSQRVFLIALQGI